MDDEETPHRLPQRRPRVDPEDRALQNELSLEIQRALRGLPEDQRIALTLADIQGMSYDEIAEITQHLARHGQVAHQPGPLQDARQLARPRGTIALYGRVL